MFTEWLRKYFTERIKNFDAEAATYLAHGLPGKWVIREGEFIGLM